MRRGLERERRIILTVVLLVGVPGIVLSALGVRHLRSEERQVEDKIRAHYASVARRIDGEVSQSLAFYADTVRDLSVRVAGVVRSPEEAAGVLERRIAEEPVYARFYLAADDGRIVHPTDRQRERLAPIVDENHPALETAQRYEFQDSDHAAAIGEYEQVLAGSAGDPGLACLALAGLARCRRKAGDPARAIEALQTIVVRHPLLADTAGMVYSLGARLELADVQRSLGLATAAAATCLEILEFLADHGPSLPPGQERFYRRRSEQALAPVLAASGSPSSGPDVAALVARWRAVETRRVQSESRRRDLTEMETVLAGPLAAWLASQSEPPRLPLWAPGAQGPRLLVPAWLRTDPRERPIAALLVELDLEVLSDSVLEPALASTPEDPQAAVLLTDADGEPVLGPAGVAGETIHASPLSSLPHLRLTILRRDAVPGADADAWTGRLLAWALALSIAGILAGIYVTLRTVSREVRSARIKSDFVSSVTHELKTPLTAIQIFVETLRSGRTEGPEETEQYLDLLSHESRSLSRLIGRILDFSKMEEGSKAFHFEPVDAGEVLRRAVGLFRTPLDGRGLPVEVDVPDELPPFRADGQALEEALWNLLDNARKYSKPGSPVRVSASQDGVECRLSVEDGGIGIPARHRSRIFEKFFRVQDDRARGVEGTGLGLAIVRHIVRAHGGRVEVDSEEGRGSTFTLVLPVSGPVPETQRGEEGVPAWRRS